MSTTKIGTTLDAIATASDILAAMRGEAVSDAASTTRTADAVALLRARTDGTSVVEVEQASERAENARQTWLDLLRSATDRRADLALAMAAASAEGMTAKSIGERYGCDNSRVPLWVAFGAWLANGGASKIPATDRETFLSASWGSLDQAKRNGLLNSDAVREAVTKGSKALGRVAEGAVSAKRDAIKQAAEAEAKAAAEAEAARVLAEAEAAEAAADIVAEAEALVGESYDPADTLTADMLAAMRESHDATGRVAACVRVRGAEMTLAEAEAVLAYAEAMLEILAGVASFAREVTVTPVAV